MSNGKPRSAGAQHGATPRNNHFSRDPVLERFLRSRNELSERQRTAIELLLRGLSDHEVAAQVGVDRGTVFRWRTASVAFQRELDRQRRALWEQSAGKIQSMVEPALSILHAQLTSGDPKLALRAAAVLLRFATPSRLAPASPHHTPGAAASDPNKQYADDLIAYCEAPLPGQPGAPEDMEDELGDEEDDLQNDQDDERHAV
jgi:hypothetical protein